MTARGAERRKEPRTAAEGAVYINSVEAGVRFIGDLVDVSASGFRVSHTVQGLERGLVVEFRHPGATGNARVMWNRVQGDSVDSGFLIL